MRDRRSGDGGGVYETGGLIGIEQHVPQIRNDRFLVEWLGVAETRLKVHRCKKKTSAGHPAPPLNRKRDSSDCVARLVTHERTRGEKAAPIRSE